MHELGIVTHLAKTLDGICEEEHITNISSVTLQVGEVSGIMTDLFVDCWDYFKPRHENLKNAILKLETIPAVTLCTDCKETYPTVQYGKECPHCHSMNTYLVDGDQCVIKEIEVNE